MAGSAPVVVAFRRSTADEATMVAGELEVSIANVRHDGAMPAWFDPARDLSLAFALADAADATSTSKFRSGELRRTFKDDGTPVSKVDFDTEQSMVDVVRLNAPADSIVGEEVGPLAGSGPSNGRRWIFDGIDGTHNYADGRPGWATILALEVDGEVVVGVVSSPMEGRRFWAVRGGGAWETKRDDSGRFDPEAALALRCTPREAIEDAKVIVTPTEGFLIGWRNQPSRRFPRPASPRSRCFALDAVMVATGEIDAAVLLFGSVWDFSAPSLIVIEAGGEFHDAWGETRRTTHTGVFTTPKLTAPILGFLATIRTAQPDRPRLAKTVRVPMIANGETDLIGAADEWTQFGIRAGASMSARTHVDNAPPFIFDLVDERASELQRPFHGVTTDGMLRTGLRSLNRQRVETGALTDATLRFLQALTPEEFRRASFAIDATEWRTWINVHMNHFRHGVMLEDLPMPTRELALEMLRTTLSARGFDHARTIMRINELVAAITRDWNAFGEWPYFVSVFGSPGTGDPWGYQFDGHHVVLNVMVIDGHIVSTPMFMGAEPRRINHGPLAGTNLFQPEEQLGLDLIRSFDDFQRSRAILLPSIHPDEIHPNLQHPFDGRMQAGAFHDNLVAPYAGIAGSELSDGQRRVLRSLLGAYVGWTANDQAEVRMREIDAHLDESWFSWMGGTDDVAPFYYRVHSPVILVEFDHHPGVVFDNEVPTRHHVHTVVRTPNGGDYGSDLLRLHHERFDHDSGDHRPR